MSDTVLTFITWFSIGTMVAMLLTHLWLQKVLSDLDDATRVILRDHLILLTVDRVDGVYLCYNSITNEFVCQGASADEIRENFRSRYPTKKAYIHRGDGEALAQLVQQINCDATQA